MQIKSRSGWWLIGGDGLIALALSVVGYLMHYAGKEPFSFRWMTTFIPLCLGWGIAALLGGLFESGMTLRWQAAAWRAALAGGLAAPFAIMLRGLLLNAAISPIFMLVMTALTALAMALWRAVWALLNVRKNAYG